MLQAVHGRLPRAAVSCSVTTPRSFALIMQVLKGMCSRPSATQQDSSALAASIGAWRPQAQQASCSPPRAASPSQPLQPGAGSAAAASGGATVSVPQGLSEQPGEATCSLPCTHCWS